MLTSEPRPDRRHVHRDRLKGGAWRLAGTGALASAVLAVALAGPPTALAATTFTWAGGAGTSDANWTTGANWVGGIAPTALGGETLIFGAPGVSQKDANDSFADGSFAQIELTDGGYTLTSSAGPVTLTGSNGVGIDDVASGSNQVDISTIDLDASLSFSASAGTLTVASPVALNNNTLTLDGGNGATVSVGHLDGGAVVKNGLATAVLDQPGAMLPDAGTTVDDGTLSLDSQEMSAGPLTVDGGTLSVDEPGTTSGDVTVDGGTVAVNAPGTTFGALTVGGTGTAALSIGQGGALAVSGAASFDPATDLSVGIGGSSGLAAASASLDGAAVQLSTGDCAALKAGDSFPVIATTGAITGPLTYVDVSGNSDTLTQGETSALLPVTLPTGCSEAPASTVATIAYGASAITATIAGVAPEPGAPATVPNPPATGTPTTGAPTQSGPPATGTPITDEPTTPVAGTPGEPEPPLVAQPAAKKRRTRARLSSIKLTQPTVTWCKGCGYPAARVNLHLSGRAAVRLKLTGEIRGHWSQIATALVHAHKGTNSIRLAGRWHGQLVPARTVRILIQMRHGDGWLTGAKFTLHVHSPYTTKVLRHSS